MRPVKQSLNSRSGHVRRRKPSGSPPKPSRTSRQVLHAFYDLRVNPNSFDVSKFLVLADLARREGNLDGIHVVIVPNGDGLARDDDLHHATEQAWRLSNIVVPACTLCPAVSGVTVAGSRGEAEALWASAVGSASPQGAVSAGGIFPDGYSVAAPVSCYEWADLGLEAGKGIPSLAAADQATAYVRHWISERAGGRKIVTLTFREMSQQPHRNNDLDAWLAFAREIDGPLYMPVIIRDTDRAMEENSEKFNGLCCFPEAAMNLEIRMALYEAAYLNMVVSNGPGETCLLNTRCSYLFFVKIAGPTGGSIVQEVPEQGIGYRGQHLVHGPHQRTLWDGDGLEALRHAFREMTETLERYPEQVAAFKRRDRFPPASVEPIELMDRLARGGRRPQVDRLAAALLAEGKIDEGYANWTQGRVRLRRGEVGDAIPFLCRAVALDDANRLCHQELALAYVRLGEVAKSAIHFRRVAELAPGDEAAQIQLAMVLGASGDEGAAEADRILRPMADRRGANLVAARALADILRNQGKLAESIRYELSARDPGAGETAAP